MKAFLLAAGNGTRLKPLTDTTPKCLLPVGGVPLLSIWLQLCRRCGITEVLLNVHANAQVVREYVSRQQNGVKVTLFEEPDLLGSAGTLAANRQWVSSEACFWVLYGDVLTNLDLVPMLQFHSSQGLAATIAVYRVADPSRCGIVSVDESRRVTRFVEKPLNSSSNLAFSGILIGTAQLLDAIPDRRPADLGYDVLPRLVGRMSAYEVRDYMLDIGTIQNYEEAQATWPGRQ